MNSSNNSIQNDYKDLQRVVHHAKHERMGRNVEDSWDAKAPKSMDSLVSQLYSRKQAMGVLHQAVYWKDKEALKILLKFPFCDIDLKTKSSKCDRIGDTSGLTASHLAAKYNHREIESLIKEVVNPVLFQSMKHSK